MSRRQAGKLGRILGQSEVGARLKLSDYLVDPFPHVSPESSVDFTSGVTDFEMLGNDQYGDCGVAGDVHLNMANAWTAGEQTVGNVTASCWPTSDQVVGTYFTYEGSPGGRPDPEYDNGVDLGQWLLWRTKHGIGPLAPIGGFASVNIDDGNEYAGALEAFGGLYTGIWVSQTDMEDFEAGHPWTDTTDMEPIGGHCVPHLARGPKWGRLITWGADQLFDWPWWRAKREEAYVVFTPEQMNAPGGTFNGVDVAALKADLEALHGTVAEEA